MSRLKPRPTMRRGSPRTLLANCAPLAQPPRCFRFFLQRFFAVGKLNYSGSDGSGKHTDYWRRRDRMLDRARGFTEVAGRVSAGAESARRHGDEHAQQRCDSLRNLLSEGFAQGEAVRGREYSRVRILRKVQSAVSQDREAGCRLEQERRARARKASSEGHHQRRAGVEADRAEGNSCARAAYSRD